MREKIRALGQSVHMELLLPIHFIFSSHWFSDISLVFSPNTGEYWFALQCVSINRQVKQKSQEAQVHLLCSLPNVEATTKGQRPSGRCTWISDGGRCQADSPGALEGCGDDHSVDLGLYEFGS